MANRINQYPDEMLCPLVDSIIKDYDCLENQSVADGILVEISLPTKYKQKKNWREICLQCDYHEID